MAFQPQINQELFIDGSAYLVAEHPVAPGMPYGQEGRAATVFLVASGDDKRAIKVFKTRFRVPGLVSGARRLAPYADLPGLQVCRRVVLTPQAEPELLRSHPDLLYAVLMPWIEGPTWMEALLEKEAWSPEQSLDMARAFAGILAGMEQEGLAHCDLSGPNVLLPALAPNLAGRASSPVALVDVEQMYGPDLRRPDVLPGGSSGYAHKTAPEGLWSSDADRFAGAVLLTEMLGWCDERVRNASWGENYFSPQEMQNDGERYRLLLTVLGERWGTGITQLFERAWHSEWLPECSTFGEWLVMLPAQVPSIASPAQELALIVHNLEAPATAGASESTTILPEMLSTPLQESSLAQGGLNDVETAALFDDGYAAYQAGDLPAARELLNEVLRRNPGYVRNGYTASRLLDEISRKQRGTPAPPDPEAETAATEAGTAPVVATTPIVDRDSSIHLPATEPLIQSSTNTSTSTTVTLTATPKTTRAVTERPNRKLGLIAVPAVVLLLLLVFGGVAIFQAQQTSQADATATAQAIAMANATGTAESEQANADAQVIAAATEQAFATETEIAAQATGTVVAQLTATENERLAASTRQVQAGETRQAQQVSTSESQVAATALAIRADLTAAPRLPAVSVENVERIETIRKLRGHYGSVSAIAISPDGKTLASTSADKKIRIWNIADGALIRTLERHTGAVQGMAFSPDGQTLASSSYDGVRVWGISDGVEIRNLEDHKDLVSSIAFSPDGLLMATAGAGEDKTARIWRAAEGKTLYVLGGPQGHKDGLTDVAFSPDGQTLATSSVDGTVRLWDVKDGNMRLTLAGPVGPVHDIAFSPDGAIIAGGAQDKRVYFWSAADGVPLRPLENFDAPPESIAFTPDGQFLAVAGSYQGNVDLWRVTDGARLRTLEGHDGSVSALAFTPDGAMLVTGSADDSVRLWGLPQPGQVATPKPQEIGIGGTGEINGVKVTLNRIRYSQEGATSENGEVYKLGEGAEFLVAEITLENTGTEPRPIYVPGEFKGLNEYRGSADITIYAKLNDNLADKGEGMLAPGAKLSGEIAFEVSKEDKGLILVYGPMTAPGEIIFKLDR